MDNILVEHDPTRADSSQPATDLQKCSGGKAPAHTTDTTGSFSLPLETAIAPSFPGLFCTASRQAAASSTRPPPELDQSDGEFEIIRELGRGASGVVYLARQTALGRNVALKVTYNEGAEARTMATLEHPNIVQVFSERVSEDRALRLICMQYVPGITLAELIDRLRENATKQLSGDLIAAVLSENLEGHLGGDRNLSYDAANSLTGCTYAQAVCQIVEQIARALHYAHRLGVIHRDVKPANVLLHPSGEPLLADFSLSFHSIESNEGNHVFGGTLAYMAPEHLDALHSGSQVERDAVDARSDIYSLGLVLYELLTLQPPSLPDATGQTRDGYCRALSDIRRADIPSLSREQDEIATLNWTLSHCLAPNPTDRFVDAGDFAVALRGCSQWIDMSRDLPELAQSSRFIGTRPLQGFWVGAIPNLLAALLAITYMYSTPRILADLNESWKRAIFIGSVCHIVLGTGVMLWAYARFVRPLAAFARNPELSTSEMRDARRRMLSGVSQITLIDFLVILPSPLFAFSVLFWSGGNISSSALVDGLSMSFVLVLIPVTLTYFASEFLAVCVAYPLLFNDTRKMQETAGQELQVVAPRLRRFHILSGIVPLAAAIGLILVGPENFAAGGYFTFRLLAIGLIIGGVGLIMAMGKVRSIIERTIALFT